MTNKVSGSFSAPGSSAAIGIIGGFAVSIRGTFTATVVLERSYDDGVTYGVADSYTTAAEENGNEPTSAALYRLRCSAFTDGPVDYDLVRSGAA